MTTRIILSLGLLLSTGLIYSDCEVEIALLKGQEVLGTKHAPTKAGSLMKFDEGIEVQFLKQDADYALIRVAITNDECPMSKKTNKCSACDCCKGCEAKCPEACASQGCCEKECIGCDQNVHQIPYNQEFALVCPDCQYSLHITITRK